MVPFLQLWPVSNLALARSVERGLFEKNVKAKKVAHFSEGLNLELRQFIAKRHSGDCAPVLGASIQMHPLQRCRNRQVGSVVSD